MIRSFIYIWVGCLAILSSCQWGGKSGGTSDMDIKVARYDRLQYEYVTMNSISALQKMNTNYPRVTKLLIEDVLALGAVDDNQINDRLLEYYSDSTLLALMEDAETKFKDLGWVEKDLAQGFKRLHREVPSLPVPRIYAQISALNQSVVVGDSLLGFSIDKYMGADYPLYKRFYHDFQSRSMEPSRIVPDCFTFYLLSQYPVPWGPGRSLLDVMMHRGKISWVVSELLEFSSLEEEIGYSEQEIAWCQQNGKRLWESMQRTGHLYSTDPMMVRTYLMPTPFLPIMDEEVPAHIGLWMGVQLIDAFMKKHSDVTVAELLERTDYPQMLAATDFQP